MESLEGGRENQILRSGKTVHRPSGHWTPAVHALLKHIHAQGFHGAPLPLEFDENGREIVTFLEGNVSNYPLTPAATSTEALTSAAKLLRAHHDASATFLNQDLSKLSWFLPPREPAEVVCHGDFAPYNVVLNGREAVAIIDFDTAHPAPRTWDIAYALYRWAPFTQPTNNDGFGTLQEQTARGRLFCTHYGLPSEKRHHLPQIMIERLHTLVSFMQSKAAAGDETFKQHLTDGHHQLYLTDITYIEQNQLFITAELST